jgi:transcriptional regulator with XRE-family HTH domain
VESIEDLLGKNVRARRKRLGLSQAELALACSMTVQSINRIERGRTLPRGPNLEAIASVLGCETSELYATDQPPQFSPELLLAVRDAATEIAKSNHIDGLSPDKQRLFELIKRLPDSRVRTLIGVLEIDTDAILSDEKDAVARKRR